MTASSSVLVRTPLTSAAGVDWYVDADRPDTPVGDRRVPAQVPGELHLDLLRAGLIPEPFDGAHESELAWIGRTDWTFRARFDWTQAQHDAAHRHDLVADGLDTVAVVRLNDAEIGRTANQHRGYRFDVTELLEIGENTLEISFTGPVTAAEQRSEELGERPYTNTHPFNAIRKMASAYGWDWGPDLAGVGIWKELRLESWSTVRLAAVRPLAGLDDTTGVLDVRAELEWEPSATEPVTLRVELGDGDDEVIGTVEVAAGQTAAALVLQAPAVAPWWPRGYGAQPLYPVRVSVADGQVGRDEWQGRVGFRSVTLDTSPDRFGTAFVIAVNGTPVWVRGANWIPDDAFLTRVDADRYRRGVEHAVDAGINLLRVWGGGIVEREDFYDACDEAGILVWQDFLLACAAYSEDEPLWSEFEAEAREAVTRLSAHASLALWNGGNENIWGSVEWGWRPRLNGLSWGDGYYSELFPRIVAELDPRTPYSPGSPYSFAPYHHPNDPRHGCTHLWEVWNALDYRHYRDSVPRFASEFGFQGPPAWSTLTSVVHDQPLDPFGPQMLVHQKAYDGNAKLERGLGDHLPHWGTDADGAVAIDDWHWLTQLNQARAVAFGIEHFRSFAPVNAGAIVWQLNDNWPVISWAAVDGHDHRKPLWYALRRVFADRFATLQPRPEPSSDPRLGFGMAVLGTDRQVGERTLAQDSAERLALVLHNDADTPWAGEALITRQRLADGTAVASAAVPFTLEPRSSRTIMLDPELTRTEHPTDEVLVAEPEGGEVVFGWFDEDPQLALTAPSEAHTVHAEPLAAGEGPGYRVTVTARALVKDLCLFPDRLDPAATVDSGLVTLPAGRSHTFVVRSGAELDPEALTAAPVLRSVNDLVARA
ncbi:beta-mannosidase [Friedmanniella endophytica]|uniref:beta-mannosidase n=1 Tax=Microlunatus kandeliicorticis TaxID=1759536 RepID=A0A7W3IPY4_9ACTN|nr:glycoside hydrolase family 2 protein [Microlunatus kandeliicorticis]MBA8793075.1 beta-mannosidase [Microlunatus kandeliicorticis]